MDFVVEINIFLDLMFLQVGQFLRELIGVQLDDFSVYSQFTN